MFNYFNQKLNFFGIICEIEINSKKNNFVIFILAPRTSAASNGPNQSQMKSEQRNRTASQSTTSSINYLLYLP